MVGLDAAGSFGIQGLTVPGRTCMLASGAAGWQLAARVVETCGALS